MASAVAVSPVEASATNILSQKLLTEKDKMTNIEIDKRIIHIFFRNCSAAKTKVELISFLKNYLLLNKNGISGLS